MGVWDALVRAYATLAILPIIPFFIVFAIVTIRNKDRKRAIKLAMDVTTTFLLGIVAELLNRRFQSHFGLFSILLVILIGAGLIGNAQSRLRGKIDVSKILRGVWRLSFFALTLLYILLMSLEIITPTHVS